MAGDKLISYLSEEAVRFWRDAEGTRPRIEVENAYCVLEPTLRLCFPLTHPLEFVCIFDKGGTELGVLKDPTKLDEDSRRILQEELEKFYFTPRILRIASLRNEASLWKWQVETQRGAATFYLRGVRDSVHEVAPNRWQVYSIDGQRYEIENLEALDARTQTFFESLF